MYRYKHIDKKFFFLFTISFLFSLLFYFLLSLFFHNYFQLSSYAQNYDPSITWNVLDGQYCSVIFPAEITDKKSFQYKHIAINIAEIADEIYLKITSQLGKPYHSDRKITIILEDFSDSAYGFASTIPHRAIRVNLTAPGPEIFDTKFESWLRILIAHEYTHLAHFDMTNKLTTFIRFFLGQIIAPNALQPLWSTEGLAIYNESKLSTGGRLQDSRYEMYLRTDFLENQLKRLDQLEGGYLVSWPGGNAPYIYGQSLIHFIAHEYGEEKLIAISEKFSSFPLLGMNWTLKKVLGIDQNELFQEWKSEKEKYFKQQIDQIIKYNDITESEQITNHQYWVDNPSWLIDEEKQKSYLVYKVLTPHLYPTIRKYDLNSKKESILIKRTAGQGISYCLSPNYQYLIYSKLIQYQHYYAFHDLFLYNLNTGKQSKLTEKMRIKDPTWHPDPFIGKLAAVINEAGTNNLVLLSFDTPQLENNLLQNKTISFSDLLYLTDFKDGIQISQPVWSPHGDKIAFSLWHKGYQDIYIITLDNCQQIQSIKPITFDHHTDINPNWSYDGQYLFFSSDRSNIFNLYAYSLPDDQFYRLTNVNTGAFEPSASPDGEEMAFIQYHSSGYELHLIKMDDMLWELMDKPEIYSSINYPTIKNNVVYFPPSRLKESEGNNQLQLCSNVQELNTNYALKSYSPRDSIIPTYWTPYININEQNFYLGFSTLAQDYLGYYTIPLTFAYSLFNDSLFYDFQFSNYKSKPLLSLTWKGETSSFSDFQVSLKFIDSGYTTEQDSGRLYTKNITIGAQREYSLTNNNTKNDDFTRDISIVNSLILKYGYNDTEKYRGSISTEIGNSFSLNCQYAIPLLNNDSSFYKVLFDGRKYFPLPPQHQVMALRLVAGFVSNELNKDIKFNLGGNFSAQDLSSINTDYFSLRGFPDSSFSGNHLFLSSLEYRFPIKMVERKIGFRQASAFLEQVSGKIFLDAGHAWDRTIFPALEDINISIGAEIDLIFKQRYTDEIILSLGIGKPITQKLPYRFYGRIGFSF